VVHAPDGRWPMSRMLEDARTARHQIQHSHFPAQGWRGQASPGST
jgi:hypothetical protein